MAEEGIAFREIAETIGRNIGVSVVSKSGSETVRPFGFLAPFVPMDNPTSSQLTQQRLGWRPREANLLDDLQQGGYFK